MPVFFPLVLLVCIQPIGQNWFCTEEDITQYCVILVMNIHIARFIIFWLRSDYYFFFTSWVLCSFIASCYSFIISTYINSTIFINNHLTFTKGLMDESIDEEYQWIVGIYILLNRLFLSSCSTLVREFWISLETFSLSSHNKLNLCK